jgi:hypothetical protein
MGVNLVDHGTEQCQVGDANKIPSDDAGWTMLTEKLRQNLELAEGLYGKNGALNKFLEPFAKRYRIRAVARESVAEVDRTRPSFK